jgi:hypothetical protein
VAPVAPVAPVANSVSIFDGNSVNLSSISDVSSPPPKPLQENRALASANTKIVVLEEQLEATKKEATLAMGKQVEVLGWAHQAEKAKLQDDHSRALAAAKKDDVAKTLPPQQLQQEGVIKAAIAGNNGAPISITINNNNNNGATHNNQCTMSTHNGNVNGNAITIVAGSKDEQDLRVALNRAFDTKRSTKQGLVDWSLAQEATDLHLEAVKPTTLKVWLRRDNSQQTGKGQGNMKPRQLNAIRAYLDQL